jgi:type IV pilus assembly protein PilB
LVERGLLTSDQLAIALAEQANAEGDRRRLGQVIVGLGLATERQIAHALADVLHLPFVDLGEVVVDRDAARLLPLGLSRRLGVLVLSRTETELRLAIADPTNVIAFDDVRLYTGTETLRAVVATESQIRDRLGRVWSLSEQPHDVSSYGDTVDTPDDELDVSAAADDAPTVRLVNRILSEAVRAHASDIHVEPQRDGLRLRYRVDGLLRPVMTLPRSAAPSVISRFKIVSGLDIAERRLPQDGRTRLVLDEGVVDTRVSTLPSVHGEKIVIRLLTRAEELPRLGSLGLVDEQLAQLRRALEAPQGLILITGPTGSGKTNTLYAGILEILRPELNVVTLEDPVEMQLDGVTQMQVNQRTGLTFARGLRAVLRQDPDVVLVGEVRDTETANLALQASLTGHLVLTTLHTNDAPGAITRLIDMGAEPFMVGSSLAMVMAQRLVRRPCPSCVQPDRPEPALLARLGLSPADLEGATPRIGRGCDDCGGTGHRGRMGLFEVLPVSAELRRVLLTNPTESTIAEAARAGGVTTMRSAGLAAAARGETTYAEVLRVTPAPGDFTS